MCALLAWYALLTQDAGGRSPAALLRDFWADLSATEWWDVGLNAALVGATRLEEYVTLPQISPYTFEAWRALTPPPAREWLNGRARLRHLLEQHVEVFAVEPRRAELGLATLRTGQDADEPLVGLPGPPLATVEVEAEPAVRRQLGQVLAQRLQ